MYLDCLSNDLAFRGTWLTLLCLRSDNAEQYAKNNYDYNQADFYTDFCYYYQYDYSNDYNDSKSIHHLGNDLSRSPM